LVVRLQFLVKDYSGLSSNMFHRLNLVDHGSFFNLQPKDVLADNKKLVAKVQMLERFNVWLEAAVVRKDGVLHIQDSTSLRH